MSKVQDLPLPKFGEWDVNDPATAAGFTVIFNRAREEKKANGSESWKSASYRRSSQHGKQSHKDRLKRRWLCLG
uniref:RIN4 pathogenic type III effector avirulence factor Avr cleavage site domain-containing protein n=1 Tax=Kalanchoe fedtschenkoi TaxID=63787 RepID=A0A7N0UVJ4_KALFE